MIPTKQASHVEKNLKDEMELRASIETIGAVTQEVMLTFQALPDHFNKFMRDVRSWEEESTPTNKAANNITNKN